jgi:hypothetical protein
MPPIADVNHEDFMSSNQSRMDEGLLVKFFLKPKQDKAASAEAGRPIFKEVEYIDIKIPGSREGVCRPARQRDIQRFPRHYQAFKTRVEGEEDVIEGTLLAEWPLATRAMVEELAFFNVRTVEQLVSMSDAKAGQFMGMNGLKAKAQQWLAAAKEQKAATDLKAELERRDEQIAAMQAQIEELMTAAKPVKPKTKKTAKQDAAEDPPEED